MLVSLAAMSDFQDEHFLLGFIDVIDNAIVTYAIAVMPSQFSGEWFDASAAAWVHLESIEAAIEPPL